MSLYKRSSRYASGCGGVAALPCAQARFSHEVYLYRVRLARVVSWDLASCERTARTQHAVTVQYREEWLKCVHARSLEQRLSQPRNR